MTIDNALLRFKPTLEAAKDLGDSKVANVFDWSFLCVLPDGIYEQTSNFDADINFGGDYKAELVDCCGKVLKDVTENIFIYQSSNGITGFQNISVEIIQIGSVYPHFGKALHLKISHWAGGFPVSDLVIYSNPFHVAYNPKEVLRIDYRGYGKNNGVDYTNANFMQSFGIKGWFNKYTDETETQKYLQQSGNTISADPTISLQAEYTFEHVTAYAQKALAQWFRSPLFYLNGIRHTAGQLSLGEREGNSNFYEGKFSAYPNELDTYTPVFQIAPLLSFTPIYPVSVYTLSGLDDRIEGQFNYPIILGTGNLYVRKVSDGSIVKTFTEADIIVDGNTFTINQPAADENGEYYITFDTSLFSFAFGQSGYTVDWNFEVLESGYYDPMYYDDDYYFTE